MIGYVGLTYLDIVSDYQLWCYIYRIPLAWITYHPVSGEQSSLTTLSLHLNYYLSVGLVQFVVDLFQVESQYPMFTKLLKYSKDDIFQIN